MKDSVLTTHRKTRTLHPKQTKRPNYASITKRKLTIHSCSRGLLPSQIQTKQTNKNERPILLLSSHYSTSHFNFTPVGVVSRGSGSGGGGNGIIIIMAQGMASNRNGHDEKTRKVMVVADPTRESASALQYALSHAVLEQDELILLHVENPNSWRNTLSTFLKMPSLGSSTTASLELGGGGGSADGEGVDFLEEMKHACRASQPKMRVRVIRVENDGRDRATTILSASKTHAVDVIVIGQKRSFSSALLGYKRSASGGGSMKGMKLIDTAEYLIQNSPCTCVSVQRKGQNGGYVLNSKTHRNFWLLA